MDRFAPPFLLLWPHLSHFPLLCQNSRNRWPHRTRSPEGFERGSRALENISVSLAGRGGGTCPHVTVALLCHGNNAHRWRRAPCPAPSATVPTLKEPHLMAEKDTLHGDPLVRAFLKVQWGRGRRSGWLPGRGDVCIGNRYLP